jgi:hypothetical protein
VNQRAHRGNRSTATLRRLVLLVGCVAVGTLVGVIGLRLSGSSTWFLAVPLLVAIAWFVVADPSACLPTNEHPSENERSAK